jgi:ubiquitin carboxyl-terminal hydrolase 8
LKRFSQNGPFRDKIDTLVDFTIHDLDLFPYLTQSAQQLLVVYYKNNGGDVVNNNNYSNYSNNAGNLPLQPPQKFDLYAISNHYGGMNGGHYTAFVRQTGLRKWFHFDDSRVTELCEMGDLKAEQSTIKTRYAYSLFYVSWAAL